MISLSSPGCQPSTDNVFTDGSIKLRTDDQICDLIANRITRFRSGGLSGKRSTRSLLQAGCNLPPSNRKEVTRSSISTPLLCTVKAVASLKEGTSRTTRSNSRSKGEEGPRITSEGSASEKKPERPAVTVVPAATSSGGPENCSLSREERQTPDVPPDVPHQQIHGGPPQEGQVRSGGPATPNQIRPSYVAGGPVLRDPQYEDISDDEDKVKRLWTELFEDISEDESQSTRNPAEIWSPRPGLNPQSGSGPAEVPLSPASDQDLTSEALDETPGDEAEQLRCLQCVHESGAGGQSLHGDDDDDDDDWDVIPVDILNLTLEEAEEPLHSENTPQDDEDEVNWGGGDPRHVKPALNPVSASAFLQMEVFDTQSEQERALSFGQLSFVTLPSFSSCEEKSESRKKSWSEPEDSCDTEDSCDYSSGPESNYLTVSKQLVGDVSTAGKRRTDQLETEEEEEATDLQASRDDVINLDSDSESDRDCMEITEREGRTSPSSDVSKQGPSPEILKGRENVQKAPVDPPTPQRQQEVAPSESSNVPRGAGPKSSGDGNLVIIVSDSDDDVCEIIGETKGPPSESADGRNAASVQPKSGAAKRNLQDPRGGSEPGSVSQGDKPKVPVRVRLQESSREVKKDQPAKEDVEQRVKRKKIKITLSRLRIPQRPDRVVLQADPSVGPSPLIPRMLIQSALHPGERDGGEAASTATSNASKHSLRDSVGRLNSKPRKRRVHNTSGLKPTQNSPRPSRHTPSPKRQRRQYDKPSASFPPFSLRREPSSSGGEQTNHARKKVFSDWQRNHVPIRRERKAWRTRR